VTGCPMNGNHLESASHKTEVTGVSEFPRDSVGLIFSNQYAKAVSNEEEQGRARVRKLLITKEHWRTQ